jgi:hypothetical protein
VEGSEDAGGGELFGDRHEHVQDDLVVFAVSSS